MPQPNLAAFQYSVPERFVVLVGTNVLNQVKSISGSTEADVPETVVRRIGEATAYTIRRAPQYSSTAEIELYDEIDLQDWLRLTGNASATAGASIDVNNTVTITVELYNAAGDKKAWHVLQGAYVTADTFPRVDADTSPATATIRLQSDSKWVHYVSTT
jgi:hypothetical protein